MSDKVKKIYLADSFVIDELGRFVVNDQKLLKEINGAVIALEGVMPPVFDFACHKDVTCSCDAGCNSDAACNLDTFCNQSCPRNGGCQ